MLPDQSIAHWQDKVQRLQQAGDALATGLAAFLGPEHDLIRLWDEAKRAGEVPAAPDETGQDADR